MPAQLVAMRNELSHLRGRRRDALGQVRSGIHLPNGIVDLYKLAISMFAAPYGAPRSL